MVSGPISQSANRAVAAKPTETLADYVPRPGKVPTEFQPGTRWAYSATAAWDTLSRIIEVVSGMPIVVTQTSSQEFLRDFETMVMQSVVGGFSRTAGTN